MGWRDWVDPDVAAQAPPPPPAGTDKQKDDEFPKFPGKVNQPPVSVTEDVLRSGAAGGRKGIEGIFGAPQDLANLAAIGAAYLSGKLGADPATQEAIRGSLDIPYIPSTEEIHQETDKWIGTSYQPQTPAGKYAGTAAEFATGALGPGGLAKQGIKAAIGAGAGLASEAAGQATAGTKYEPWARAGAGIATGAGIDAGAGAGKFVKTADDRAAEIAAADAAAQHGVKLTRGQRTGNIEQQRTEQQMLHGQKGTWAERLMKQRERESLERIKDASATVTDTAAPTRGGTPVESGGLLNQQTKARAEQLRGEGAAGIEKAINEGVMIDADALRGLPAELQSNLAGPNQYVPKITLSARTPAANQAMDLVQGFIKQAQDPNVKEVSLAGIEDLRQTLNTLSPDPGSYDSKAFSDVMGYLDDWYDKSIDQSARIMPDPNALPSGTPRDPRDVLAELKASRGKYGEGAQIDRPRKPYPPGGKAVSKIATDALPENTARLFTPNDAGNLSVPAIEALDRLIKVGAGTADLDQVRGIILDRLLTGDPGKVAARVDNFIKNNPSAANQLFSAADLAKMQSLAGTNKRLVPDPKATNPSRSSYSIVKEAAKTGVRKVAGSIPLVGPVIESGAAAIGNVKGRREALEALKDVNRDTLTRTVVKKGAAGAEKARVGAIQGAMSYTIDDPGGPDHGKTGKLIEMGDNMIRLRMPDGSVKQIGKALVK